MAADLATVTFASEFTTVKGIDAQIIDFIRKLQSQPDLPGLDLKRPQGAVDKNVRTARINKQYRAVIFSLSGSAGQHFVLARILDHDEAYDYASRAHLDTNPVTGVAVLREEPAGTTPVAPEDNSLAKAQEAERQAAEQAAAETEAAAVPEVETEAEPVPEPEPAPEPSPRPLRTLNDALAGSDATTADLRDRLGLSDETIEFVRALTDIDNADRALHDRGISELDRDLLNAVFAEYSIDEIIDEFSLGAQSTSDSDDGEDSNQDALIESLQHPASQASFITLSEDATDEDLQDLIDSASFNDWRIFLHPAQQSLVTANFAGQGRVFGGAGTGKTIVAVHRANALVTERGMRPELSKDSPRVLLTTYTRGLADSLKSLMNLKNPAFPEATIPGAPGLTISGIDSVIHRVLTQAQTTEVQQAMHEGLGFQGELDSLSGLDGRQEIDLWSEAVAVAGEDLSPDKANPEFLSQEYSTVVLGQGITQEARYLRARRRGRGTSLSRSERKAVWHIIEIFQNKCLSAGRLTWAASAIVAAEILGSRRQKNPDFALFDHALVDEAQDFHAGHWRFLRAAVAEGPNDIFIAEDPHQRIYGQHLVLSHFGITTRGRASRRLTRNYRTTAETLRYALRILEGTDWQDAEGAADTTAGTRSLRHGAEPIVATASTEAEQIEQVADQIRRWKESAPGEVSIGVLTRSRAQVRKLTGALSASGLDATGTKQANVAAEHDVAVMTMHSAKGLEFTHVVLMGVDATSMPQQFRMRGLADAEKEDILQRERALLYVAASRARDGLMVTVLGRPTELLP